MRKSLRWPALVSFGALLALPGLAAANCYSIFDASNQLRYQSTNAPIDLSKPISAAMRSRFATGAFLIMLPDESDCREIRTGSTVSPRFDTGVPGAATPADETLQASSLLSGRGSSPAGDNGTSRGGAATRESVRSGNALNIRR